MIELDQIYCEDCLEGMKRIPDGSVDAIICDLPYGVLNKGNKHTQWDNIIPFEPLWEQYLRVLKENGAICLFGSGMFTAQVMVSQPKLWRYNLIWHKDRATGFLNAGKRPLRCHEDIMIFYRSSPTYNAQMEDLNGREPSHSQGYGVHKITNQCYGNIHSIETYVPRDPCKKFPQSIIRIAKEHTADTWHPTQKPVELLRWLVRTYTNKGETVLDNCMGSGTTAVACMREGRHFVGFEMCEEYWRRACERVRNERMEQELKFDV